MRVSFLLVPLVMVPLVSSQAQMVKDCNLKTICAGVRPGGGRVMECLKEHKDSLSDQCLLAIGRQIVGLPSEKRLEAVPSAAPSAPATPAAPANPDASSAPATPAAPATPDTASPTTTDQPPK
jgi:hypothetical protein